MSTDTSKKRIRKTPEQRLAALTQQLAKAKADVRKNDRQADTRRKILVGGSLLALAKQGEPEARRILDKVPKMLAEKDQLELAPFLAEHGADPDLAAAELKNQAGRGLSPADRVMVDVMTRMFGPDGGLKAGERKHWAALTHLARLTEKERDVLFDHWQSQGWPMA